MSASRIHRLLKLITLIQSGRATSVRHITDELAVSRRTLFRDLKTLEHAGIPCSHQPGLGYRIATGFFLPPTHLTVLETLAIMLLAKDAAARTAWPMRYQALAAIDKLTATTPEPIRSACNDLLANVSIDPGATPLDASQTRYYTTLKRCIDEQRAAKISYKEPLKSNPFTDTLQPYVLHFANRAWYVIGRLTNLPEPRLLKLNRITELEPLDQRFTRPPNYTAKTKLANAWQLIRENGTRHIVLEFKPKVATNVSEVRWHPTQQHEFLPDGRCRMTFDVDGIHEIAWWICGYANQVVVIKPPALRDLVQQMLTTAATQYQTTNTPTLEPITTHLDPKTLNNPHPNPNSP